MLTNQTHPVPREQAERALLLWRGGARLYEALGARRQDDYQRAIDSAQRYLQRFTTMAELANAYLGVDAADAGAEGDDWLERVCGLESSGIRLSRGIVEDVAYWRRLRQLVSSGVAPGRE